MFNFDEKYNEYLNYFNENLDIAFKKLQTINDNKILEACIYSVKNCGKRIRPVLCLSTAEMLGINKEEVINLAIAIELIHSYSLVHDDLPCMDNDDFRRGKLSTHKKYGEAYGVLCGDALLNLAFEIALDKNDISLDYVKALKLIANYAGFSGMIFGQTLDIEAEKSTNISEENLYDIYLNKTAKLLTAPLLVASLINKKIYFETLKTIGNYLGYLFQIQDDILDETGEKEVIGKTAHKDKDQNKLTAVKLYGLEKSKEKVDFYFNSIINLLKEIPNSEFLSQLVYKIYARKS